MYGRVRAFLENLNVTDARTRPYIYGRCPGSGFK